MRRVVAIVGLAAVIAGCGKSESTEDQEASVQPATEDTAAATADATDPYLWLEEVEGEQALEWVREQNERSLAEVTANSLYEDNLDKALSLATDDERIPYGTIRDGFVYNFWQDDTNVRGLWRRTPVASYRNPEPEWETVLDFDALAASEDKN